MSRKYPTIFAAVVLFLKVVLHQHKLDVPFNGGLGSYKLYVLVAYAIERLYENNNNNNNNNNRNPQSMSSSPTEVLLSCLYRYGGTKCRENFDHQSQKLTQPQRQERRERRLRLQTTLSREKTLECTDVRAQADLSNVFQLDEITELFAFCYNVLAGKLYTNTKKNLTVGNNSNQQQQKRNNQNNNHLPSSLLSSVIQTSQLTKERQHILKKAENAASKLASSTNNFLRTSSPISTSLTSSSVVLRKIPTYGIPSSLLDRLDDELAAFANYVRLQPAEDYCRRTFIRHLETEANKVFASSSTSSGADPRTRAAADQTNNMSDEEDRTDVRVQVVMGPSCAAGPLCAFSCMINLVMSGPSLQLQQNQKPTNSKLGPTGKKRSASNTAGKSDDDSSAQKKKHERIKRWRELLEAADGSTDAGGGSEEKGANASGPKAIGQDHVDDVIDLTADSDEGKKLSSKQTPENDNMIDLTYDEDDEGGSDGDQSSAASSHGNGSSSEDTADELLPLKNRTATKRKQERWSGNSSSDDESATGDKDGDIVNELGFLVHRSLDDPSRTTTTRGSNVARKPQSLHDDDSGWSTDEENSGQYKNDSDSDSLDDSGIEVSFVTHTPGHSQGVKTIFNGHRHQKEQSKTQTRYMKVLGNLCRGLKGSWFVGPQPRVVKLVVSDQQPANVRMPVALIDSPLGITAELGLIEDMEETAEIDNDVNGDYVGKYKSFAPVVLFLKVLLSQRGLDQASKGGIPGHTLHTLVLHHIEKHLEHGGADRPSDVLLSFFFRYGATRNSFTGEAVDDAARTDLSQDERLSYSTCDTHADLTNVTLLDHIVNLLHSCWEGLLEGLRKAKKPAIGSSTSGACRSANGDFSMDTAILGNGSEWLLAPLVDSTRLHRERHEALAKAHKYYGGSY